MFAHKRIQVAKSEYFCGMFNTAWSESSAVLKRPLPEIVKKYQAKMAPPVTRLEFTYKHLPELHDITIECDDSKEVFVADCFRVVEGQVVTKMTPHVTKLEFTYKHRAELHDITIE